MDFRNQLAVGRNFAVYPSEVDGLRELQELHQLRTPFDVIRHLVHRHRHISPEIKAKFRRARKAKP